MLRPFRCAIATGIVASMCASNPCAAQDLEPRRWTHLPTGTDVFGLSYLYTTGDLAFDPVLRIEDAEVDLNTVAAAYTRYFAIGDRTARIDVIVPVQSGRWEGLVNGEPRTVKRDGLADPVLRFSTHLIGSEAVSAEDFPAYRREHDGETTVGAALELRLPLGDYDSDKLINLGSNRFAIGGQLGALHTSGEWSYELTGTTIFFTDNDEFFGGLGLEQDPLFAMQAHVVKTFAGGYWGSVGAAYSWGGESTVDGSAKDDEKSSVVYGASFGFRVGDSQGLRVAYARTDTLTDIGTEAHSVLLSWSIRF